VRLLFGIPVHADGRQAVAIDLPTRSVSHAPSRRRDTDPVVTETAYAGRSTTSGSSFSPVRRRLLNACRRPFWTEGKTKFLDPGLAGLVLRIGELPAQP
jgi:hypothetical protein